MNIVTSSVRQAVKRRWLTRRLHTHTFALENIAAQTRYDLDIQAVLQAEIAWIERELLELDPGRQHPRAGLFGWLLTQLGGVRTPSRHITQDRQDRNGNTSEPAST